MPSLGEPKQLREDILPTKLDVYNHFLFTRDEKLASGEWTKFTPLLQERIRPVLRDICTVWDKTGIPHCFSTRLGEKKVTNLISQCRDLNKVPMSRRDKEQVQGLLTLFDGSLCPHTDTLTCDCPQGCKVQYN